MPGSWQVLGFFACSLQVFYHSSTQLDVNRDGQVIGSLVSTALVFQDADPAYYIKLMDRSLKLYGAAMRHRGKYSDEYIYKCAPQV